MRHLGCGPTDAAARTSQLLGHRIPLQLTNARCRRAPFSSIERVCFIRSISARHARTLLPIVHWRPILTVPPEFTPRMSAHNSSVGCCRSTRWHISALRRSVSLFYSSDGLTVVMIAPGRDELLPPSRWATHQRERFVDDKRRDSSLTHHLIRAPRTAVSLRRGPSPTRSSTS